MTVDRGEEQGGLNWIGIRRNHDSRKRNLPILVIPGLSTSSHPGHGDRESLLFGPGDGERRGLDDSHLQQQASLGTRSSEIHQTNNISGGVSTQLRDRA